jgi:hypothetical protein
MLKAINWLTFLTSSPLHPLVLVIKLRTSWKFSFVRGQERSFTEATQAWINQSDVGLFVKSANQSSSSLGIIKQFFSMKCLVKREVCITKRLLQEIQLSSRKLEGWETFSKRLVCGARHTSFYLIFSTPGSYGTAYVLGRKWSNDIAQFNDSA